MTTVAVFVDPPREGLVLPAVPETSPLTAVEAAELYAAMTGDVLRAVHGSGGDLLVNYRPDELIPERFHGERRAEAECRALVREALPADADVRVEVQVGSTFAARAGNTVTHLLEREEVASVAIVEATVPLLERTHVDNAAMRLRRTETVLGPTPAGDVYYAGFTDTIDFADAFDPPALETLTTRSLDADNEVDFLPWLPTVRTGEDLVSVVSAIRARAAAGRTVPTSTAALIEALGLHVAVEDDARVLARG